MITTNSISEINILFGKRVRELREKKNLSQEELANLTGFHRTYIGQIERAEKNITLKSIEKIANSFYINIKELFDFTNINRGEP